MIRADDRRPMVPRGFFPLRREPVGESVAVRRKERYDADSSGAFSP